MFSCYLPEDFLISSIFSQLNTNSANLRMNSNNTKISSPKSVPSQKKTYNTLNR